MRKPALVLSWTLACSVVVAGCGRSAADVASYELTRRIHSCLGDDRVGEVTVEAWILGGPGIQVGPTSGLSGDEEACVRDLLAQQAGTASAHGHRFRVRIHRERDTHPALRFLRARRAAVSACRPCSRTRIVATPAGDRYELAAELVGDEPELEPDERACIAAALADMPPPPDDDAREAVAAFGGSCR